MTELETLERARMYMEKLANGINPIDGAVIPEGETVNNVRLSRCFFYVADVLRQVIDNGGVTKQKKTERIPFDLPVAQRDAFAFSNQPLTISEIVKRINDLIPQEEMMRLPSTAFTEWLLSIELLCEEQSAMGKTVKRPTKRGEALGMALATREGRNGPYSVIVYHLEAQHFLLDNLDAALEYISLYKENKGKPWTAEQERQLLELYNRSVPMKEIARTLKRTMSAIRSHLKKLDIFV